MVQFIDDSTRRFKRRPLYKRVEIDAIADKVLADYAKATGVEVTYPITDDILQSVIEFNASRFDPFADLSHIERDVDAYTMFYNDRNPAVLVNRDLAGDQYRLRQRMTLAHELGHVVIHAPLYRTDEQQLQLIKTDAETSVYCKGRDILKSTDWCEWQASYFAGNLLLPTQQAHAVLRINKQAWMRGRIDEASLEALQMIKVLAGAFEVSKEAARVRLSQIYLIERKPIQSLLETGE